MKPRLGQGVMLTPLKNETHDVTDSWARALIFKANAVQLGGQIPVDRYVLRDSMRYNVMYKIGSDVAQVVALCDGTRDIKKLAVDASQILGKENHEIEMLAEKTVAFLTERKLLDSPARRIRKLLFWVNPSRVFKALRYIAAYHLLGRRS